MHTSHCTLALAVVLAAFGCSNSSSDGGSPVDGGATGGAKYTAMFAVNASGVAGQFEKSSDAVSSCVTTMGTCKLYDCPVARPQTFSAGRLTLSGGQLAAPVVMTPDATLGTYGATLTKPSFKVGDTFQLIADGADVPKFSALSSAAPADITITAPPGTPGSTGVHYAIDTSKALVVGWTGGDIGFEVEVDVVNADDATKDLAVRCQFAAEIGVANIPAAALGTLGTPASGTFSAYSITTGTSPDTNVSVTIELAGAATQGAWGQ